MRSMTQELSQKLRHAGQPMGTPGLASETWDPRDQSHKGYCLIIV